MILLSKALQIFFNTLEEGARQQSRGLVKKLLSKSIYKT